MAAVQRDTAHRVTRFGKAALAGLLIAWVLVAAVFSSSHYLHELVHHDSHKTTHQCAFSLFERGQLLDGEVGTEVPRIEREPSIAVSNSAPVFFSSVILASQSSRGPPV